MVISTFADRLWWARHRAGLGATRLARLVGCSQSLISSLERNNAEKSRLNNKFADALNVDPTWLAYGVEDRTPTGFDPTEARHGREAMGSGTDMSPVNVVRLPEPRWASDSGSAAAAPSLVGADAMQKQLVALFMDYARLAGQERTIMFLVTLQHIAKLVAFEEAEGQDKVGAVDKGDNGTH
jgi:hypothetical protein